MMAVLWEQVRSALFLLANAQSWLLFALGFACSLFALLEIAGIDDPYPGFGAVGREREEAISNYAREKAGCIGDLSATKDEAINKMIAVIQTLRRDEYDLRLAIEGRQRDHRDYLSYLDHLAVAYDRLIRQCREANERSRTTPAPEYFGTSPSRPAFLAPPPPPISVDPNSDARVACIARMEHYIKAVNDEFTANLALYDSVGSITETNKVLHAAA